MIGAHELLLIVRAQNQASAALGRVARDIRGLETRRTLGMRQQALAMRQMQLSQQMAREGARIESVVSANGSRRLAIQRQRISLAGREQNIQSRIANLAGRQHAIDTQRLRSANRLWDLTYRQSRAAENLTKFAQRQQIVMTKTGKLMSVESGRFISPTSKAGMRYRDLQHNLERVTKQIEEAQMASKGLNYRQDALARSAKDLAAQTANVKAQMAGLNAREREQIAEAQRLTVQYQLLTKQSQLVAMQQMEIAHAISMQRWETFATASRTVAHLGRVMQMFGLVASASFGFAAKSAADFRSQLTLAATQARQPGAPVAQTGRIAAQLNDRVLKQMQRFPSSAEDMSKALYDIFSGTNVQNIAEANKLLAVFNKEAVAGGTDLDTMTQAGITLFNNFPKQFKNATDAGNKFFAMVRYGRGTAKEFADSLGNIIPIAKQTGQSVEQVFQMLAAASRVNPNLKQNAIGYSRLLMLIARPEVRAGFKKIGIDVVNTTGGIKNLMKIADQIPQHFKTPVQAINFFKTISAAATGTAGVQGRIQAQRFWANLVKNIGQYHKVAKDVSSDNNEFVRSWQALSKSPGVRWAVFTNQLKALAIMIGQGAMPAFARLASYLKTIAHWFNNLSPATKRAIGYFAAMVSIGALVTGSFLSIAGSIAAMYFGFRLFTGARLFEKTAAAAGDAGGAMRLFGNEAGLINTRLATGLGIFALVIAFTKFHHQTMAVINALGGLKTVLTTVGIAFAALRLGPVLVAVGRMIIAYTQLAVAVVRFRIAAVLTGTTVAAANVEAAATTAAAWRAALVTTGWGALLVAASFAAAYTITHWKKVKAWFGIFWAYLKATGFASLEALKQAAKAAVYMIVSYMTLGIRALLKLATYLPFVSGAAKKALGAINGVLNALKPNIKAVGNAFTNNLVLPIKEASKATHNWLQWLVQVLQYAAGQKKHQQFIQNLQSIFAAGAPARQRARAQAQVHLTQSIMAQITKIVALYTKAQTTNSLADWKAYYQAYNALTKKYKGATLQAIEAVISAQENAAKKTKKVTDKTAQDAQQTVQNMLSNLQTLYDRFFQQNQQAFGTLFSGPFVNNPLTQNKLNWGGMLNTTDLLKDLNQQVMGFAKWRRDLNQLTKRGLPQSFIDQVVQLGPQAAQQQVELINKMTPEQLKRYKTLWQKGQNEIHKATMRDLNKQVKQYETFGKKVARAIIAGVKSENVQVQNVLADLIGKMFPGLVKQAEKAKTPSARTRRGGSASLGTGKTGRAASATTVIHETHKYDIKIDGAKDASTKAQVRHAIFAANNRYGRHR